MSRGYGDNRGRREGRRRDGGYRDYREPRIMPLGTPFPHDPPPDYTSEPDYPRGYPREAEYQHHPAERSNPPPLRRRGLNEDYYNSGRDEHETPRHHRKERSSRRGNHRHEDLRRDDHRRDDHRRGDHRHEEHRRSRTTNGDFADDYFQPKHKRRDDDNDEVSDDYSQPKPRRRAKTESRGRHRERSSRRHSDDRHSDDKRYESMPETPSKPKRGRSFLNAIGINKAEKPIERGRSPARSLSRGRRDSSYSRSPPRRHRSARGHDKRSSRARDGGPGLKHSNTQWQRAAARAAQAGATAAFELRNDPSPWMGPKGVRVATAALGAAMVDTFMEDKHPKRAGGMRHRAIRQVSEAALRHVISGRGRSRKRDHY